jgi:hypothetical protein
MSAPAAAALVGVAAWIFWWLGYTAGARDERKRRPSGRFIDLTNMNRRAGR